MTLEKDKVYKVKHTSFTTNVYGWTNNIIFSPINDIEIPEGFFDKYDVFPPIRDIKTHFTVCFDRKIATKYDSRPSETGLDHNCIMLKITDVPKLIIPVIFPPLYSGFCWILQIEKITAL
jgi:hypothetical protein